MSREYVSRSFHADYGTCYRCGKPCDHTSITIIRNGESKKLCNVCFDEVFDSIKPLAAKATSDKTASDKPLTIEESKYQMRMECPYCGTGLVLKSELPLLVLPDKGGFGYSPTADWTPPKKLEVPV